MREGLVDPTALILPILLTANNHHSPPPRSNFEKSNCTLQLFNSMRTGKLPHINHIQIMRFMKHPSMGFFISLTITFFAVAAAEEFEVGSGSGGWRPPGPNETEMYSQWASSKRFHVGDSLRFQYTNDSVLIVDKTGYYHCNSTNPIKVFDDGNTVVVLDRPGPAYFASGDQDRCKNGERLMVDVMKDHQMTPSSSSPHSGAASMPFMKQLMLLSFSYFGFFTMYHR